MDADEKRSRQVYATFTPDEYRRVSEHCAVRDLTMSGFLREATLIALSKKDSPRNRSVGRPKKPGAQTWLWQQLREQLAHWESLECEDEFAPFVPRAAYVGEICRGTSLNASEANRVIDQFLLKWKNKIAKMVRRLKLRHFGNEDA